jgi:hypothetical protein
MTVVYAGLVTQSAGALRAVACGNCGRTLAPDAPRPMLADGHLGCRSCADRVRCTVCEVSLPASARGDVLDCAGRCDRCRP